MYVRAFSESRFCSISLFPALEAEGSWPANNPITDYQALPVWVTLTLMTRIIPRQLFFTLAMLIFATLGHAQSTTSPPEDEPDFIVPARPTVSNPAEFQRAGVLQLEIGYDANFHSKGNFDCQQDMPLALRFAISHRFLVELDTDSPYSLKDPIGRRNTGAGDTQLGFQAVLFHENRSRPGVAFAYYIKFPTANRNKGLGTGRFDHSFIALVSKKVSKTTVDFNAIYFIAGRTSGQGHASSVQVAIAASRNLTKKFGVQGEISGSSRNDQQAGTMFGLGVVTFQINRRTVFDSGLRFGLTPGAPRLGVVAGMTVGIANLYKKRH